MSYDIWLEIDTGNPEGPAPVTDWINYTSNCSGMWTEALGGEGLRDLQGMAGADAAPLLNDAIKDMAAHPQTYEPMAPENGWGSYDGALNYLIRIREMCMEHPLATIGMSY